MIVGKGVTVPRGGVESSGSEAGGCLLRWSLDRTSSEMD